MTHTIDISSIKSITDSCLYYDYITNYDIDYHDKYTFELVNWYKDVVFLNNFKVGNDLDIIKEIDKSVYTYLYDTKYRREVKKNIDIYNFRGCSSNIVIKKIINFNKHYENKLYFYINNSKWL